MKRHFATLILRASLPLMAVAAILGAHACTRAEASELRYGFPDILDIRYSPDTLHRCTGWFTDAGAWFGFTPPERGRLPEGFHGPFSLDMNSRRWVAECGVQARRSDSRAPLSDSSVYYPGELRLTSLYDDGEIAQTLCFVDSSSALLCIDNTTSSPLLLCGRGWHPDISLEREGNSVVATHPSGELIAITFLPDVTLDVKADNYSAAVPSVRKEFVVVSLFDSPAALAPGLENAGRILLEPENAIAATAARWEGYLKSTLRNDMPEAYDRIAAKAITTLASNRRAARGGLLHDGIIPSHAVGYFVGLWAWDSWRFSAGAAAFDPELAKNNIRAMFDYQLPDGMIVDCIYTDPAENNLRDSKPPLVCWAVDKIWEATADTAFVAEMYPQLMAYYKWWFDKRDHDGNGICEYGSCDGTLEAAAWESGMDNAIRFDNTRMLQNADDAWSMDRESVDLNAYLANECRYLKKFAKILGEECDAPDHSDRMADYFFDPSRGFFFDRLLGSDNFAGDPACEAYVMLWTGLARPEQVEAMMPTLRDSTKFSTFIPFPTVAADNPAYNPRGYWRGPIWLDQTYFAISGLRNYGYGDLADEYTRQVFNRLDGISDGAPIHENYDAHTGERLKAPHFSWSASHLIMLYQEYGH